MTAIAWSRPLGGRDPDEEGRASTPLELFFDLCFVVAVAAAATALHHDLAEGHYSGIGWYGAIFFSIWWCWVNYSWFASAYDTGDVIFRLMTFMVMTGVLVVAAGIPRGAGKDHDFSLLVVGYVIMRIALVPMWLKVARDHPAVRAAALRYAVGITVLQVLWVARVLWFQDGTVGVVTLVAVGVLEMVTPWVAEHSGQRTPWHAEHICERYQLFTIIVLGEVILATTQAISATLDADGFSGNLFLVVAGGLLLVLALWWIYFKRPMIDSLGEESAFFFGYAHYFVFASVAAVGATLATAVDVVTDHADVEPRTAALLLAGAVTVYLLALGSIHAFADGSLDALAGPVLISAGVLAAALAGTTLSDQVGLSVLLIGLVVSGAVVDHQVRAGRAPDIEPVER